MQNLPGEATTSTGYTSGTSATRNILIQALIRLSLQVGQRNEDDRNIEARIEIYADDLMAWGDLQCALWCLNEHARRSRWWPAWAEIEALAIEWRRERAPCPSPAPEHRRLEHRRVTNEFVPLPNKLEWDLFCESLHKLRDPSVPMLVREPLLAIGEAMYVRQLPHAKAMGWVR